MERTQLLEVIAEVINIDMGDVDENVSLSSIEFTSLEKLGIISAFDVYLNKIISSKDLKDCVNIKDILDLGLDENV